MIWFHRFFPPALMLTAVIYTHLVKRRPGQQTEGETALLARLWIATIAFIALHVIVQGTLEATLPAEASLRSGWPTLIAVLGCVTLWTRFAAPALAAREPGYRPLFNEVPNGPIEEEPHPGPAVRSASLRARHETPEIGPRVWTAGWATFGLCAVATAWAVAEGAPVVMLLGLGWWIGMAFFGARATRMEPEPMDPAGSPKLAASYAKNRAFRSWVFFGLGLAGTVTYTFLAVALFAFPQSAGMLGAVLGSALGVAGAVFGVVASLHRAKTQALLHELGQAD